MTQDRLNELKEKWADWANTKQIRAGAYNASKIELKRAEASYKMAKKAASFCAGLPTPNILSLNTISTAKRSRTRS